MGDEATKKDLQALQVTVNKKIADLDAKVNKAITEDNTAYNKILEQINKYIAELQKASTEHGTAIDAHARFHAEVRTSINAANQAIKALQAK